LGENEIKIIELIKDNKCITTKELSERIKISTTAIDKNISKLKKKRILKRIGSTKGGYWKVIEKQKMKNEEKISTRNQKRL